MNHVISVVTAVHEPSVQYLGAAYESLRTQALPAGWSWEWLVQEDGLTGTASSALPLDDRIRLGANRQGGPGVARNMALARATGSLIRVLDADDQLTSGALQREIEVLADPQIGWSTTSVLDLLPDGSTEGWVHSDPPEGLLPRGGVLDYFHQHQYRLPVHPAALCIRKQLALALGGWMALPGGEDTGLLLAASVVSDGYFIGEPGLLYRKHEAQITAQPGWSDSSEWTTRMQLIEARAAALQQQTPDAFPTPDDA
ncbi:MAG: glycosyltransferase family 2 protein [Micromonosporaceae bacterium]